jgi:flagellar motor switch protein FliG
MSSTSRAGEETDLTSSPRQPGAPRSVRLVEEPEPGAESLEASRRGSHPSISPLRKAAVVLVSLDQSLASRLLAQLDRSAVEAVTWEIAHLDSLEASEQAIALQEFLELGLRRLCFAFEDVVRLNEEDIRTAYRDEDAGTWALALAGAAPPVRARVLGALRASSAANLQRTLEGLGPFRLSQAEAAQAQISERIRRLYDQGAIDLPVPSHREEVVV